VFEGKFIYFGGFRVVSKDALQTKGQTYTAGIVFYLYLLFVFISSSIHDDLDIFSDDT